MNISSTSYVCSIVYTSRFKEDAFASSRKASSEGFYSRIVGSVCELLVQLVVVHHLSNSSVKLPQGVFFEYVVRSRRAAQLNDDS